MKPVALKVASLAMVQMRKHLGHLGFKIPKRLEEAKSNPKSGDA
jgi:hypothetical protein